MRALALAAVAAALLVLPAVASTGAKNACVLVTATDTSKAVGSKVGSKRHTSGGGFNICSYTLGKVSVTVKTRPVSGAGYAKAVKTIPGTALAATDISAEAWVFFVGNGIALDDWKGGDELDLVVVGGGGNTELILRKLAMTARTRL
jgi:hypothetical protein